MPENLRIGLMVSESRKKCQNTSCPLEYYGLAFGQSPFHVPEPLKNGLIDDASYGIDNSKTEAHQGIDAAHGKTGDKILKELVR